jgi:hypothetical protein
MRMMTLDDVVRAGQEGAEWKQQQRQVKRAEAQQTADDEANQAFSQAVEAGRKRHLESGGDPNAWKPGDQDFLRGVQARGVALLRAGNHEGFFKNIAAADAQIRRIAGTALQQFQADKDPVKLAQAVYPTLFDGQEIVDAQLVQGGPEGAPKGAPSGPSMLRVKLSSGEVRNVNPEQLVASVEESLRDPMKAVEDRAKLALQTALAKIEQDKQIGVQRVRGEEDRKTATVRNEGTLAAVDRRADRSMEETRFREGEATRRTNISAGATLGAAKIRSGGDGGDDGTVKTLEQANLAVNTARNALHQATQAATAIRLGGVDSLKLDSDGRAAVVDRDPQVQAARREYEQALAVRNRLAQGGSAAAPSPAPAAGGATPGVLRFDRNGNLIK